MTTPEMNALNRKNAALCVVLTGAGLLSACGTAFAPKTDMTSPVAPQVQALVEANRDYPRWEDFPRGEPAPEPTQIAVQVNTLRVSAGALNGEAARIDWQTTGDASTFAREVRDRVAATPVSPVTAQTQAEIEARLRAARERGRAPPPINRQ
ncbi:hypothetical protein [Brevundimonas sp. GCM10030266]|uniref:hypothetical protein n=1 Tax=Brevundimonas sp. GCM10030266 TaxID=3273386 RepID=UPI003622A3E8